MNKESMINDLTEGSVARTLLTFSIPFMFSNILQTAYNVADMVIVGQYVGSTGLSAVSVGGDIMHFFMFLGMGLTMAGQIMIAQYVGQRNVEYIKKTIGTLFTFISLIALFISLVGIIFDNLLLSAMNVPPEAYAQAKEYSIVCFIGMIFMFGYNLVSSILRGMGDSKRPFVFIAVAACLNILFDLILVAGLGMGPKGAAIATIAAQAISCASSIIYLYKKRNAFGFDFKLKSFAIDGKVLKALLRLGIPLALQRSAIMLSKLFVSSSINVYGVTASAVNGVGGKIRQVSGLVTVSLGAAGTSMIGQNFGAGKKDRIKKIIYVSLGYGLVFVTVLSVFMMIFPEQIFGLFNSDPGVLELSHSYAIIAVMGFFASALRSPFMALINGLGNTKLAMVLGLLDGVIARVGLAMLLGIVMKLGIQGFWYGDALAGFIPFVIGGIYYWSGMWKRRRLAVA